MFGMPSARHDRSAELDASLSKSTPQDSLHHRILLWTSVAAADGRQEGYIRENSHTSAQ